MSPRSVTRLDITRFQRLVRRYYRRSGRHLPWRTTNDPYRILVSEVMLQQTQVDRVVPKFEVFLKRFPTVRSLAHAPQRDILRAWQGLGYNRRALLLHRAAREIVLRYHGRVPREQAELMTLPGIGGYTAAAIRAFAFDLPGVCIETNIRAVFIHHFFPRTVRVPDAKLLPLIERALDRKEPRAWYSALMDYGSTLKRTVENPARRSAHHTKQEPFRGSRRQARGRILRFLTEHSSASFPALHRAVALDRTLVDSCLRSLIDEGFVTRSGQRVRLK